MGDWNKTRQNMFLNSVLESTLVLWQRKTVGPGAGGVGVGSYATTSGQNTQIKTFYDALKLLKEVKSNHFWIKSLYCYMEFV